VFLYVFLAPLYLLRLFIQFQPFYYKTMQMVGATKAFIRKPFVMRSVKRMIMPLLAIFALVAF
jgi:cell division transport system permease protein